MSLFIYDPSTKTILDQLLDSEYELVSKNLQSTPSQDILQRLRDSKKWLGCSCKQPLALMFTRQKDGHLTLVNHYKQGKHSEGCIFHSTVMGKDRKQNEINDEDLNDRASREDTFFLFRPYAKEKDEDEENKKQSNSSSSSKKSLNALIRILYNCIDRSHQNYFFGDALNNEEKEITHQLMILRDATKGMKLKAANNRNLLDITFVGEKGYDIAESFLLKEQSSLINNQRPMSLIVIAGQGFQYNKRLSTITVSTVDSGVVHLTEVENEPIYGADIAHCFDEPCIVVAALTFKSPHSRYPVIAKSAVLPILGEGSLCPVSNKFEASFLKVCNEVIRYMKERIKDDITLYVSKQLFGFKDHPEIQPNIVATAKSDNGHYERVFIEILPNDRKKEMELANVNLDNILKYYKGERSVFRAYQYDGAKADQFVPKATTYIHKMFTNMINRLNERQ